MRLAFFVTLCFLLFHVCLKAERLSFTDRNRDELCGDGPYCSEVRIKQYEVGSLYNNKRLFTLRVVITLYPNIASEDDAASVATKTADAKTADVDVVVETGDQLKHQYTQRNVPIRFQGKGENLLRYCDLEIGIPEFEIVAVHAIDAREKDRKGNVLFRHRFR